MCHALMTLTNRFSIICMAASTASAVSLLGMAYAASCGRGALPPRSIARPSQLCGGKPFSTRQRYHRAQCHTFALVTPNGSSFCSVAIIAHPIGYTVPSLRLAYNLACTASSVSRAERADILGKFSPRIVSALVLTQYPRAEMVSIARRAAPRKWTNGAWKSQSGRSYTGF